MHSQYPVLCLYTMLLSVVSLHIRRCAGLVLHILLGIFLTAELIHAPLALAQRVDHSHSGRVTPFDERPRVIDFTVNQGQLADQYGTPMPEVLCYAESRGVKFYFTKRGFHYVFSRSLAGHDSSNDLKRQFQRRCEPPSDSVELLRVDIAFLNTNPEVRVTYDDRTNGHTNYYLAHCPEGITHVPSYGKVTYHDLYPGIDMVLYGTVEGMKYDFVVQPGGDPSQIAMQVNGAQLELDSAGGLLMRSEFGYIKEELPYTYEDHHAHRQTVPSRFHLDGNTIRFELGQYDRSELLVIDPPRLWGTYYGGSGGEEIYFVGADNSDNVFIAGFTYSLNNIATAGAHKTIVDGMDGFVAKFNASGARQWGTYYGGANADYFYAGAVDRDGNLITSGSTTSSTSISTPGVHQENLDAGLASTCIVKFATDGTRLWGTYAGGSYSDFSAGLAVDSSSNIIVAGRTDSPDGIATAGTHQTALAGQNDGYVMKFSSSGQRLWGTYYGGVNYETIVGVAVDGSNNILITGETNSSTGIATPGTHKDVLGGNWNQAFIAKLAPAGTRVWGTYYGSSIAGGDITSSIAAEKTGHVLVTGWTGNTSGIATPGTHQPSLVGGSAAFLARFEPTGVLDWGTYYYTSTGNGSELGTAVAVDQRGNICMGGVSGSASGMASSSNEYQTSLAGNVDGFVAKFDSTGKRKWGTYYGGPNRDWIRDAAFDRQGHVLIAGTTRSTSAIASAGAHQAVHGGSNDDGYVVKFCDTTAAYLRTSTVPAICQGEAIDLIASDGFTSYQWQRNGTNITGATAKVYTVPTTLAVGSYKFTVQVTDPSSCATGTDTINLIVRARPIVTASANTQICLGSNTQLNGSASGAVAPYTYSWTPQLGLSDASIANPIASPTSTTVYTLTVTDANLCSNTSTVTVTVNPPPVVEPAVDVVMCYADTVQLGNEVTVGTGTPPFTYRWAPSAGLVADNVAQPLASPSTTTIYNVTVTDSKGCVAVDTVEVTVRELPIAHAGNDTTICVGSTISIGYPATGGVGGYLYHWKEKLMFRPEFSQQVSPDRTTTYIMEAMDANGCIGRDTITITVNPVPSPAIVAAGTMPFCEGDSLILQTSLPYTGYIWSTGETTPLIVVKTSGTYYVTVTDANGCVGTSTLLPVSVNPRPPVTVKGPREVCTNTVTSYEVALLTGASYDWTLTPATGATIEAGQGTNKIRIRWSTAGTYQLTLHSSMASTGCSRDTTITITVDELLRPSITADGPLSFCQGDSVVLEASSGYINYRWSPGGETTERITVNSTGSYTVTVIAEGGCEGTSDAVVVTVHPEPPPKPVITVSSSNLCDGDTALLSTTQPYANYRWSTGETTSTIRVTQSGTYRLIAQNAFGCEGGAEVTVRFGTIPVVAISADRPLQLCEGESITLSATAGHTLYEWSTGERTGSITVTPATSQDVWVRVTSADGCSNRDTVSLTVNPNPKPVVTGPTSVCFDSRAFYSTSATPNVSYTWTVSPGATIVNGAGTPTIEVQWPSSTTGWVEVEARNTATGCIGITRLEVRIGSSLAPTITSNDPLTFCEGEQATLDAGSGYASYAWSKDGSPIAGASTQYLVVSTSGTYTVVVSDGGNCTGESMPVTVVVYPLPPIPVITRAGITLSSTAAYSYQWQRDGQDVPGATTQSINTTLAGSYRVTITDANGCSSVSEPYDFEVLATATVSVPSLLSALPGEAIDVPIRITQSEYLTESGASAYRAEIRFNKTLLAVRGSTPGGMEVGDDRIITFDGTSDAASGLLRELEFIAALGNDTCTDITIDLFEFTDANVTVTREHGRFCLEGVCIADGKVRLIDPDLRASITASYPNPASSILHVEFELSEEGMTQLYVSDLLGKQVLPVLRRAMPSGKFTQDIDISSIASGHYRIVLETPSQVLSNPIQISR